MLPSTQVASTRLQIVIATTSMVPDDTADQSGFRPFGRVPRSGHARQLDEAGHVERVVLAIAVAVEVRGCGQAQALRGEGRLEPALVQRAVVAEAAREVGVAEGSDEVDVVARDPADDVE